MKIKKDLFKTEKVDKEEADRKKEIARIEREEARRLLEADKKDLNLEKYRIVLERLLSNWIQLNITCMTLGFAIYKFYHSRIVSGETPMGGSINGWHVGIFLISLGLVTLVFATLQHYANVTKLKLQFKTMQYSLSLRVAYVMIFFSAIILIVVIFKG